jgi:VWFA-related protein
MRRAAVALLLIVLTAFAFTQEKPFGVVANVTAIEVTAEVVDASGKIPPDLKASDFVIIEDGVERPVASLEYLCAQCGAAAAPSATTAETIATAAPAAAATPAAQWDILVYIDYELSSRTTIRDAVRSLTTEAERLTRNGRVEIVVADPSPRRLLAPTNDAKAVADALTAAGKINAQSRLANVRRAFIENTDDKTGASGPSYAGMTDMRSSVAEEGMLIQNFLGRLSAWLGGYPRQTSRALMLVADGFDINPGDFYSDAMAPAVPAERHTTNRVAAGGGNSVADDVRAQRMASRARTESGKLQSDELSDSRRAYHPLAAQAAAAGWTIISMRGGLNAELAADSSMGSGNKVVSNFNTNGGGTGRATRGLQARPVEALATFAEATGGTLVADTSKFGKTIDTLANRVRLTYEVSRPVDGLVHQIDVKAVRAGLKVNASRYASSSTPELVANSRAATLIENGTAPGELPVSAKLALDKGSKGNPKGTLEARVALAPIAPLKSQLKSATMRVTIGVATGKEQPRIIHQLHPNFDLSQLSNATFTSPMQLPKNVDKVAIVIEELSTGAWGGTVLPVAKNQDVITTAGWTDAAVDPMNWLPYETALKEAQKVGKLIVQCAGCDESMFADSTLRNTLNTAFVVTNKPDTTPHVLLLDPWGHQRFDWKPANAPDLVAKLRMAVSVGSALVQAGSQGDTPEAHFSLGFAYLRTQSFEDAQREYSLAETGARAKGDNVLAQRAQIQHAAARGQSGKRNEAIASLEKIVKAPQSPLTEAEAWLILGHLRKGSGNEKGAREAYTTAAQRAPQGSEIQKVATKLASGG